MTCLQFGQRITHHFLCQAGAFSAFSRNTQRFTDFTITAAAFQNCIPDLTVGDTLAEANIHKLWTVAGLLLGAEELNVNENACQNCFGLYSGRAMSGCFRKKSIMDCSLGRPAAGMKKPAQGRSIHRRHDLSRRNLANRPFLSSG